MTAAATVVFASLTLQVTAIEGPGGTRDNSSEIAHGVNLADCLDPASTEITVRVDEGIEDKLDLWVSFDDDCESTASRTGDDRSCFDIGVQVDDLDDDGELTVRLDDLEAGDVDACATTTSGGTIVYLHVFDSGLDSTTGELGDIPRGVVALAVDPVPPDEPEITSGDGSGATAVRVAWQALTDGDAAELQYTLVGEAAGPGCTKSGVKLKAGAAVPAGVVELETVIGATSASVDPSNEELALQDGDGMLVGAVAVDPAGNVGLVSNLVCVTRVPTAGYCDVLAEEGERCAAGCAAGGGAPVGLAPILAVLLALRARRPRRGVALALLVAAPALAEDGRPATLTLGAGVARPDATAAFSTTFGDEAGPLLGAELQLGLLRIPHVGWLGAGVGAGWASYGGRTCRLGDDGRPDCSGRTTEEARLVLVPFTALASLRVEALARELGVPLVVTPKLGLESVYYKSKAGRVVDGEGIAHGLRWALEVALELDGLDREAASALRRDSGIEHAFVFVQAFGSVSQSAIVADSLAWTAGLGFSF